MSSRGILVVFLLLTLLAFCKVFPYPHVREHIMMESNESEEEFEDSLTDKVFGGIFDSVFGAALQ
ncbi:hypothetical protein TELCIR_10457 [Teladorsagia circumcincta]|uniref:Uncharacterized protein n=1 Tax=Teladorsagia circumcincta TaxID=45464 RepID=A0A2G9UC27_TELCI|nr:hypothetical protein TELCIR_10457 [Teladorsagia circumcincta]